MKNPKLYIISGCNGSGKTTASYTVLPEMLKIKEFVNADEIAKGLSPFQPDKMAIKAGRIMVQRINGLLSHTSSFAIETTLSGRSLLNVIAKAKRSHYEVHLLYIWLESKELAVKRVKERVEKGGHNIPNMTIRRRYSRGLVHFFKEYMKECHKWSVFDNSRNKIIFVAEGEKNSVKFIENEAIWGEIRKQFERENV